MRIIKKRINPIYNEAINGVYERHALKIELKTGATKPELVIDENYSDDWIPPLKDIKKAVIDKYLALRPSGTP